MSLAGRGRVSFRNPCQAGCRPSSGHTKAPETLCLLTQGTTRPLTAPPKQGSREAAQAHVTPAGPRAATKDTTPATPLGTPARVENREHYTSPGSSLDRGRTQGEARTPRWGRASPRPHRKRPIQVANSPVQTVPLSVNGGPSQSFPTNAPIGVEPTQGDSSQEVGSKGRKNKKAESQRAEHEPCTFMNKSIYLYPPPVMLMKRSEAKLQNNQKISYPSLPLFHDK